MCILEKNLIISSAENSPCSFDKVQGVPRPTVLNISNKINPELEGTSRSLVKVRSSAFSASGAFHYQRHFFRNSASQSRSPCSGIPTCHLHFLDDNIYWFRQLLEMKTGDWKSQSGTRKNLLGMGWLKMMCTGSSASSGSAHLRGKIRKGTTRTMAPWLIYSLQAISSKVQWITVMSLCSRLQLSRMAVLPTWVIIMKWHFLKRLLNYIIHSGRSLCRWNHCMSA